MTLPRWLAAVTAAIIFATSVVLALAGVPDAISGPGDVFANLGRNLLSTLAVALLAYLWFYYWTSYHATHRLRDQARAQPESLFPIPPRVGRAKDVFGREALVEEVATNLKRNFRTGPQLLVGDTGSGKTSLLLALAQHFAQNDVFPIVLSLRDAEQIDFAEMAETRFKEYVDPHVRTVGDADKLWRWMCRRGDIVVLADDLDRANVAGMSADPYKMAARLALDAASRRNLPLVVTSRPDGLPPDLDVAPIEVGPLTLETNDAVDRILARVGNRDAERNAVRDNIERGNLVVNPFYIGVVTDLLRLRSLKPPPTGGEHAVRVALLETWRDGLLGGETVLEDERRRRDVVLDRVADFAAARLTPESESIEDDAASSEREWLPALHAAERFELVGIDEEGRHRFKHDVMHAYFASRVLTHHRDTLLEALEHSPDAPRVQLAVIFAAAATRDRNFCRDVCEALLTDSSPVADERRLLRAVAAAEVARAGEFRDLDERIAATCARARRDASPLTRRAALQQVGTLSGASAIRALWEFAGDDSYDVRWAAAETLVDRCSGDSARPRNLDAAVFVSGAHAYRVLGAGIEESLKRAECLPAPRDDWTPEIVPLKHMAWILPALKTRTTASNDDQLKTDVAQHLNRLLRLEAKPVTLQRGLEASIAQGFKADAQLNRDAGVNGEALSMLSRAKFWYSQINLLHALTVRVAYGGRLPEEKKHVTDLLPDLRHPFVTAAAVLCDRALDEVAQKLVPEAVDRYIWEDEGKLVSSRPTGLVDEAIQLVGDMVVLLNMNETGDEQERERFGENNDLPYCMHRSPDRREVFDECINGDECEFQICPYQPAINRLSAHREISRAFCRHQQLHATAAAAQLWGSKVAERSLHDYWGELELKARM